MDEEKYWEQPEDLTLDSLEATEGTAETLDNLKELEGSQVQEDMQHSEAENGETVGKFKDANALLEAYNNLEKEFTKKCQRLSELEKDKIKEEEKLDKKVEEKLALFLSSNGEATNYKDELVEKVKSDDSLKKMDDPFSYVWAEMVFDKIKNQKTSDEAVKNYILGNENLKNAVIESYINQLSENKSPIIISSNGNRVATVATQNPANLDDAKKYLIDLLS